VGGATRDTYLAVKNTGPTCVMAVKVTSCPSGWTVNNGSWPVADFIVCNNGSDVGAGQTVYPGPFKVTPPSEGGSGSITWELWRVYWYGIGVAGYWVWDQKLYTKTFVVSATSAWSGQITSVVPASPGYFTYSADGQLTVNIKNTGIAGNLIVQLNDGADPAGWYLQGRVLPEDNVLDGQVAASGRCGPDVYRQTVAEPAGGGEDHCG